MTEAETAVIVAVISAVVSLASLLYTHWSGKKLRDHQSRIDDMLSEGNARRDYRYEARKRLYAECEPLVFQLVEASHLALRRVQDLAELSRDNIIQEKGRRGYLRSSGYYLSSTVYLLLAPLAIAKLIRERLTAVDLALDPRIRTQYELANLLSMLLTDESRIVRCGAQLDYEPFSPNAKRLEAGDPARY